MLPQALCLLHALTLKHQVAAPVSGSTQSTAQSCLVWDCCVQWSDVEGTNVGAAQGVIVVRDKVISSLALNITSL